MLLAQEMPALGPWPEFSPLVTMAAMVLIVVLAASFVMWCLIRANVARAFARIFAVLAIGAGIGVLTWGICAEATEMQIRSPFGLVYLISHPIEAIGWGAGLLAGGITAMVLSVAGCSRRLPPM
ncbi:MAG: hypothetical protein ACYC6Y_20985 [Thermoguttaceae bacterium]